MSQRIDRRFANWQGLHIDKDTVEPDELARAFMDYLDCECTYFPSMSDDDPIMSAYTYAQRLGVREGFIPVLVNVDEGLWENIIGNSDPDSESSDDYTFNREKVNEFRRRLLEAPVMDGKSILDKLTGQDNDDIDEEPEGGFDNNRYSSYWNTDTNMTHPLILARIPVTEPWKIFAYLPFGNWNDCPANPELIPSQSIGTRNTVLFREPLPATSWSMNFQLPFRKTEQWKPQYSNMLSVRIWTRAVTA